MKGFLLQFPLLIFACSNGLAERFNQSLQPKWRYRAIRGNSSVKCNRLFSNEIRNLKLNF